MILENTQTLDNVTIKTFINDCYSVDFEFNTEGLIENVEIDHRTNPFAPNIKVELSANLVNEISVDLSYDTCFGISEVDNLVKDLTSAKSVALFVENYLKELSSIH